VGTLTVSDVAITANEAGGGAGILLDNGATGSLTVIRSTISGNSTLNGGGDRGGGIYAASTGQLYVYNSTISDNSSSAGGGIDTTITTLIVNSTLANNRTTGTTGWGGNLDANYEYHYPQISITIQNSIFTDGQAYHGADIAGLWYLRATILSRIKTSLV